MTTVVFAVAAALAVSLAGLILRHPRQWVTGKLCRAWAAVSPARHERDRAETRRLTAELAELKAERTSDLAVMQRLSAELEELHTWRQDAERAIARVAAQLTAEWCSQEGNPDDEYRSDLDAWFRGDPDADIDYRRKQERDLARLAAGEFRRR